MDIPNVAEGKIFSRDDRIYEDSKGRPVGIAAVINRITKTNASPQNIPFMTPEDKRVFDRLFNRCVDTANAFSHYHPPSYKKKSP